MSGSLPTDVNRARTPLGGGAETVDEEDDVIGPGDPDLEYEHVRTAAGLSRVPDRGMLRLVGDDRVRFLQGLVTCDVQELGPGEQAYGYFTTARGRVFSEVTVLASGDALDLVVPKEMTGPLLEHLSKFIVMDRVEASLRDGQPVLALGPEAEPQLRRSGLSFLGSGEQPRHGEGTFEGAPLQWMRDARRGVPAWLLWVAGEHRAEVIRKLLDRTALMIVGALALETVRVEAGIPSLGREFDAETLPQEMGEEGAVSYTKGCYLGQEVVARIHYRGKVNRRLRGLLLPGEPVPGGTELRASDEDRPVGGVGTSVRSSRAGRTIGLALLHRRGGDPGDRVRLPEGDEVEVVELPFSFAD